MSTEAASHPSVPDPASPPPVPRGDPGPADPPTPQSTPATSQHDVPAPDGSSPQDRPARRTLAVAGLALCGVHAAYVLLSGVPPSWDEAQYLSAAHEIAAGIKAGDPGAAWHGWAAVVTKKAPLVTVPAAVSILVCGEGTTGPLLVQVLVLAGLVAAAWSLFRNVLPPWEAALGAWLLATAPLITGLTHRVYVELLQVFLLVLYLDVLVRRRGDGWGWTVVLGLLMGLGTLTKVTFPFLAGPATAVAWFADWRAGGRTDARRRAGELALRGAVLLGVAVLPCLTWYVRHWKRVWEHVRQSTLDPILGYDGVGAVLAFVSQGPFLFVTVLAAIGLAGLVLRHRFGGAWGLVMPPCPRAEPATVSRAALTWAVVLCVGAVTAVTVIGATSKMLRPTVTWLPAFALLAAGAPRLAGLPPTWAARTGIGAAALAGMLMLHNCFGVLPVGPVRAGDLVIVDSRLSLNVPDWYRDNVPLDTRTYPLQALADAVVDDAAKRHPGSPDDRVPSHPWEARYRVRITGNNLVFSDHLFHYLARRDHFAWWALWPSAEELRLGATEYVVHAEGLTPLWGGRLYAEFVPDFRTRPEIDGRRYELLADLPGPGGSRFSAWRRR